MYDPYRTILTPTEEDIEKFKELLKKEHPDKQFSDSEARESAQSLLNLVSVLWDCWRDEEMRKKRLEKEPKGFMLEDGRTCCICRETSNQIWYDKHGMKCMSCQNALNKRIIPVSACKNEDNKTFFTSYDLQRDLELHSSTIRKMIREKKLTPRNIPTENGQGTHYQIFLKKENASFLESLVKVKTKDGIKVRLPQTGK